MKTKKFIVIFLCAIMLLSAVSCSDNSRPDDTAEQSEITTQAETPEGTTEEPIKDIYGIADGYSFHESAFNVRYIDYTAVPFTLTFDTELNGEMVNDVIFGRNRKIEDKLKVKFVQSKDTYAQNYAILESLVGSGSDELDLIMQINRNAYTAALRGYILSTNNLPFVDLTKDYYYKEINSQLSIMGNTFICYGADALNVFEDTACVLFNKELAEQKKLGDIYSLVKSGDWTHEVFQTMMKDVVQDLNGDGIMDDNDFWGVSSCSDTFYRAIWISGGEKIVIKDNDDVPSFAAEGNTRFMDVYGNALEFLKSNQVYKNCKTNRQEPINVFMNNKSMFTLALICQCSSLSSMSDDFGLVPVPKYNKDQEDYCSFVADAWTYVVPGTNKNPEGTSIIMEALAYETQETIIPVYYEQNLKFRRLRDMESVDMLEKVRNTLSFDLGTVTWLDFATYLTADGIISNPGTLASMIKGMTKMVNNKIKDAIETFENS